MSVEYIRTSIDDRWDDTVGIRNKQIRELLRVVDDCAACLETAADDLEWSGVNPADVERYRNKAKELRGEVGDG